MRRSVWAETGDESVASNKTGILPGDDRGVERGEGERDSKKRLIILQSVHII